MDSARRGAEATGSAESARYWTNRILLLVDLVAVVWALAGWNGPARFFAGLSLAVLIPGWVIVDRLRLGRLEWEIGLAIALSMSLLILIGQAMMTLHLWHPVGAEVLLGILCAPPLVLRSRLW